MKRAWKVHPNLTRQNWRSFFQNLQKTRLIRKQEVQDYLIFHRAYWDFEFFATYFFPHYCQFPFSKMHLDFCRAEEEPARRGRREVIAAPRGNAKTTFKLTFKTLHAIAYEYEPFIALFTHSQPEALEKIQNILRELEQNSRYCRIYGDLAPVRGNQQGLARWGRNHFVTQNGISVMAKSKGQEIRGRNYMGNRPSLIICDDVESPDEIYSAEQRAKTRDWFFKDVSMAGPVDGSANIIVIGTCLHQESLLSELLCNPGYQGARYQAVQSYATNQGLWEQWQSIFTDLSNPNRQADAQQFFDAHQAMMLEGTAVLWPEGENYKRLMEIRISEGVASFQSEKQNDPFDPERQLFDMRLARRFRMSFNAHGFSDLHWLGEREKTVSRKELIEIIAFHDPALGKKPGQRTEPDFAAIVVVAKDQDGYLYCLDAYIEKDPPSKQIQRAFQLFDKWDLDKLYVEENLFQELLKDMYATVNNQRAGPSLRIKGVSQYRNKVERISTLETDIANGYLLFADTLNPRLMEQLTLFPSSYDDGPDALQGAVQQLKTRYDPVRNAPSNSTVWIPPWKR